MFRYGVAESNFFVQHNTWFKWFKRNVVKCDKHFHILWYMGDDILRSVNTVWQNFEPYFCKFLSYWEIFDTCKWPDIAKSFWPSANIESNPRSWNILFHGHSKIPVSLFLLLKWSSLGRVQLSITFGYAYLMNATAYHLDYKPSSPSSMALICGCSL